jgi:transposase
MDLESYEELVSSESRARRYLLGFCWKNHQRFCPRCRSRRLYRLASGRRRCARCRDTFHDFSGRWIDRGALSCRQWLRVIKLFELEVSTRRIAHQVRLSYATAYKAVTTLRLAVLARSTDGQALLSGEIELDEAYFGARRKGKRGRGAANKIPVFGILERGGEVCVEVVPHVTAANLLGLTVTKVRRGSIVYTDRYHLYDALMFCGYRHLRVDKSVSFAQGKVYINGLEGFWSFAKQRLAKHHGVSPARFPLYLKELEFRYNHRHDDLFARVAAALCNLVPNLS